MKYAPEPTADMGPFLVELWGTAAFRLYRRASILGELGGGEFTERLLIEPAELPALRAALLQVWAHPHFAENRWDTTRSWLTSDAPHEYTAEQIADANAPWAVARTGAAVVIEGPWWNPTVYPSGAFTAEVEYARLEKLLAALGEV